MNINFFNSTSVDSDGKTPITSHEFLRREKILRAQNRLLTHIAVQAAKLNCPPADIFPGFYEFDEAVEDATIELYIDCKVVK